MIIKMFGIEIRTGDDLRRDDAPIAVESSTNHSSPNHPISSEVAVYSEPVAEESSSHYASRGSFRGIVIDSISSFGLLKDKRLSGVKIANRSNKPTRASMVDNIIMPPPPAINDVLDSEIYINNVELFRKEMINESFFSICLIDKFIRHCDLSLNKETTKSYRYLHSLHCKSYSDMDDRTLPLIVACINFIFTDGASENPEYLFSQE